MKNKHLARDFLRAAYRYLLFFLLVAFVTTCCMTLFVKTLTESMDIKLTAENLNAAAKLTFANVLIISFLFALIDGVRRKLTVVKPVKRIVAGAEKIMRGDFSVRLKKSRLGTDGAFNEIIDCFNRLAEELGGVETLRADFIADVSHEMKTPLAVLQNYATLLQTCGLSEEKRSEYAKGIADGVRRMSDMVSDILRLNRLENQKIYPNVSEFDLGEQLCECLLRYENVWESANIDIETDIADEIKVNADAELLSHVWNNLLSNAFKFTPSGGTVSVTLSADALHAVVEVKDTGCGMSAEVGEHIFEKFYQADASRSVGGNGLGLALVKRVIDIMRGEISVESAEGKGSAFTVKIRRA